MNQVNVYRLPATICAVIGMLGTFLPWPTLLISWRDGLVGKSRSGIESIDGKIILALFLYALFCCLFQSKPGPCSGAPRISASVLSLAAAILAVMNIRSYEAVFHDGKIQNYLTAPPAGGLGLYLIAIAGFTLPLMTVVIKPMRTPRWTKRKMADSASGKRDPGTD